MRSFPPRLLPVVLLGALLLLLAQGNTLPAAASVGSSDSESAELGVSAPAPVKHSAPQVAVVATGLTVHPSAFTSEVVTLTGEAVVSTVFIPASAPRSPPL